MIEVKEDLKAATAKSKQLQHRGRFLVFGSEVNRIRRVPKKGESHWPDCQCGAENWNQNRQPILQDCVNCSSWPKETPLQLNGP
ncbi:hypothetical protein ElyMa_005406400 [Elysia marginata]|uniref:Uncharacterized protein n=1 Tax=Elysia marginata TaxID=1093978 RepID=A0AAV4EH79_9GAST|nr:hypothetical protein ElyMa_005406400 [Elysia marginata]